jgi:hypothetical protein
MLASYHRSVYGRLMRGDCGHLQIMAASSAEAAGGRGGEIRFREMIFDAEPGVPPPKSSILRTRKLGC